MATRASRIALTEITALKTRVEALE